ncbi:hypothetical protein [Psychromicrobium xiongbiense]|uniref:hypothetical protein n=1 Tax=Psychromicrobium xiongbiense TaxID=3051184 RepID=UPI00255590EB|nr:hypothetical protein [Psychromicrobium sp. YIM S02556]
MDDDTGGMSARDRAGTSVLLLCIVIGMGAGALIGTVFGQPAIGFGIGSIVGILCGVVLAVLNGPRRRR